MFNYYSRLLLSFLEFILNVLIYKAHSFVTFLANLNVQLAIIVVSSIVALPLIIFLLYVVNYFYFFFKSFDITKQSDYPTFYQDVYNFKYNFSFEIPLWYKIKDVQNTWVNIIMYLLPFIFFGIFLRLSRLGTEINLYLIFTNYWSLPFIVKFYLFIILILYVLSIKYFFAGLLVRLGFELRKIYIYSYKFGTEIDPNSFEYQYYKYQEPSFYDNKFGYLERFLLQYIRKSLYYRNISILHDIYEDPRSNYSWRYDLKNDFKYTSKTSMLLLPLYYFLRLSTWKYSKLAEILRRFLSWIRYNAGRNYWIFLHLWPYVLMFLDLSLELYHNHGIITKLHYYLFFIFFYKMYIRVCKFLHEFSDHTREWDILPLCVYYYKLDDLYNPTVYGKFLRHKFEFKETLADIQKLELLLLTGLNNTLTSFIITNYTPKKSIIEKVMTKLAKRIVELKIYKVMYKINKKCFSKK